MLAFETLVAISSLSALLVWLAVQYKRGEKINWMLVILLTTINVFVALKEWKH
jgi:hypothetical protein